MVPFTSSGYSTEVSVNTDKPVPLLYTTILFALERCSVPILNGCEIVDALGLFTINVYLFPLYNVISPCTFPAVSSIINELALEPVI